MQRARTSLAAVLAIALSPLSALAWNSPTHMINGAMAYRILKSETPSAAANVQAILEKHPWYAGRWRSNLDALPEPRHGEMIFMLAARWADDIRIKDWGQHRGPWHYINWPFRPDGETGDTKPAEQVNILTAIAENKKIARESSELEKRALALAWLFHLVGDIHQPLHSVQLFTREYPNGDRGGNEMCVRVGPDRPAINLHRLWDGLITSTNNVGQLSKIATELIAKFSRVGLRELERTTPEAWTKESYEIAVKIAYENGSLRGTPRGTARDCREVRDADFLSRGYPARAKLIAERRVYLAAYRLAALLAFVDGSK